MLDKLSLKIAISLGLILIPYSSNANQKLADIGNQISSKIERIQTADFINFSEQNGTTFVIENLQVRHLYMIVRQNQNFLSQFSKINGLAPLPQVDFPSRKWTEDDLAKMLEEQNKSLDSLLNYYHLTSTNNRDINNDSNDFINVLTSIGIKIQTLGIPAQDPGIAFQFADLIINQLYAIAEYKNVDLTSLSIEEQSQKKIHDAYLASLSVAGELQYFSTEFAKVTIPGGVLSPDPIDGQSNIDDLISILQIIAADLISLKRKLDINGEISLPEYHADKTPSDIYNHMTKAFEVIFALEDAYMQ